jgi:predicted alpha/beta-fold hydrolase
MAPLHGFDGVHDYYARCRPNQFLKDIKVPTLVIHALDDPFMSPLVIPQASELSPMIHFELAETGGHVGFISGSVTNPVYYLEHRIPAFLNYVYSLQH